MNRLNLSMIESIVVKDNRHMFSIMSLATVLLIALNLLFVHSFLLGAVASFLYFAINALFLGHAFFNKEKLLSRVLHGSLLSFLFLGLFAWITMISYNLDNLRSMMALVSLAIFCSLLNKLRGTQTEPNGESTEERAQLIVTKRPSFLRLNVVRLIYLSIFSITVYLLVISRAEEVYTIWQVLHPLFLPMYFVLSLILVTIILSEEKTHVKLLFVITHSILTHVFFFTIFPAGDIGGQQGILSITRRIYNNLTFFGYGHSGNILVQIYYWFSGINFQSAFSIILARMFSVDVFWSHLALIPFAWGIFVPLITYLITRTLCANETVAALSSLAVLAFPATIYWGALSVPNSLGFIFALGSLYFVLRYVSSKDGNSRFLMLLFSFAALISHYLTGMITLALLSVAIAVKAYQTEKEVVPTTSKFLILVAFIFGVSVLPVSLVYHRLLSPLYSAFSLYLWRTEPIGELLQRFVLGEYFGYGPLAFAIFAAGPAIGLLGIIYVLRTKKPRINNSYTSSAFFLFLGFFLVIADYQILKFFMAGVPFKAERVWVIRDFIAAPFLAILGCSLIAHLRKTPFVVSSSITFGLTSLHNPSYRSNRRSIIAYALAIIAVSGWISASLYYAYPHNAPLQTTSYEIEAVEYIEKNTSGKYVVIADQWIIFAAQMLVGAYNPHAYYFGPADTTGIRLFIEMKNNSTVATMIEAQKYNNATVTYFVIEKPRLSPETYNRVIQQAEQNGVATFQKFYYRGEEKITVFYYEKATN